jgi:uncharacterized phage-like protein YoqJ
MGWWNSENEERSELSNRLYQYLRYFSLTRKIVAGTGHRPNKLGGYSKRAEQKVYQLAFNALNDVDCIVISGMALGWDQALAEAALNLGLEVWGFLPCLEQDYRWLESAKRRYRAMLERLHKIEYAYNDVYPGAWCLQRRNEMMVDRCDVVLALWDGSSGGTGNCIEYATDQRKPIINLWQHWTGTP